MRTKNIISYYIFRKSNSGAAEREALLFAMKARLSSALLRAYGGKLSEVFC
jgi:hypothetical protein